jgi:hypothetical protein
MFEGCARALSEHRFMKRIVIEAKHQNPSSPLLAWEQSRESGFDFYRSDLLIRPEPRTFRITDIHENDWKISWETDYHDDFKKVASVVGKEKAREVLRALKGAVPVNWEQRSAND